MWLPAVKIKKREKFFYATLLPLVCEVRTVPVALSMPS